MAQKNKGDKGKEILSAILSYIWAFLSFVKEHLPKFPKGEHRGEKPGNRGSKSGKGGRDVRNIITWTVQVVVVVGIAWTLAFCFCQRAVMTGSAMEPTLEDGDKVLLNMLSVKVGSPNRGDMIAFYPNGNTQSHIYLRRVVGIPGDTVQIKDGVLYVNDEKVDLAGEDGSIQSAGLVEEKLTLEKGEYFVMGDSPQSSEDSRSNNIGTVTQSDMVGKAWFILSPNSRSGPI